MAFREPLLDGNHISVGLAVPAHLSLSIVAKRILAMMNPATVVSAAAGRATLTANVRSGWACLLAPMTSRIITSKAAKIKKQTAPLIKPIIEALNFLRIEVHRGCWLQPWPESH